MKRYAIVRVDGNQCVKCEHYYDNENGNKDCRLRVGANFLCDRYGDTKEQLIRKVAQVIFKVKLARYRQVWKCECSEMEKKGRYTDSLILARKIVEFLGVEE